MIRLPQCNRCKHERPYYEGMTQFQCSAFPDEIPLEILLNKHDHRLPYPGDNGILFEPKEAKGEEEQGYNGKLTV